MVDINAAYKDAKFLSDDDLKKELSTPTGMIPGYIVMSEMQDRKAIRAGSMAPPNQMSMKDEMLAGQSQPMPQQPQPAGAFRQYASGGMVKQLNPLEALTTVQNAAAGGLPALQAAQAPGAAQAPQALPSLNPAGIPQQPLHYAMGGLASLRR